jgi:ABC-type transporter Mla subunit MlaD
MRFRALAVAALALVPFAAACGDDGGKDTSAEAKVFCGVVAPVQGLAGITDKADDTKTVQARFTAAESALAAVSGAPPADLKADLDTVTATFNAANKVLKANAYSFDKAAAADAKAIEALDDPKFTKATDNIQTWATKNCEGFAKK